MAAILNSKLSKREEVVVDYRVNTARSVVEYTRPVRRVFDPDNHGVAGVTISLDKDFTLVQGDVYYDHGDRYISRFGDPNFRMIKVDHDTYAKLLNLSSVYIPSNYSTSNTGKDIISFVKRTESYDSWLSFLNKNARDLKTEVCTLHNKVVAYSKNNVIGEYNFDLNYGLIDFVVFK